MRRYLIVGFLGALLLATPFTAVSAQDLGAGLVRNAADKAGFDKNTNETTFAAIIGDVIKTLLSFVGVIFLVLMVYAGFIWMNARGDERQIEKAQSIIRAAIFGLIITVGAYSITAFVVPRIVERTSGPASAPPAAQQNPPAPNQN